MNKSNRIFSVAFALLLVLGCFTASAGLPDTYRFAVIDINNGLTPKQVNCFYKDSRGFVWIGTAAGLNRYDGYQLKVFQHDSKDSTSIISNNVTNIFEGPEGFVWIASSKGFSLFDYKSGHFYQNWQEQLKKYGLPALNVERIFKDESGSFWFVQNGVGLSHYNPADKSLVTLQHSPSDPESISSNLISAVERDMQGNYWLVHRNGMLDKLDSRTLRVVERQDYFFKMFQGKQLNYKLTADSDGDLWVYLPADMKGVFYYNSASGTIQHFHTGSSPLKLNTNLVTAVVEESAGTIWIGTDLGGINVINKRNFTVEYVLHNPEAKNSLVHNSIYSLYRDYEGMIWVGAYKNGVNYYHKSLIRFQHFKNFVSVPNSLPYDDINCFEEDEKGDLWIGTNGGGLLYFNRSTGTFTRYEHDPLDSGSISSNIIVSLELDRENNLWVGTYLGGLNKFDGEKFTHYRNVPANPDSQLLENIWELFEDSKGNLWIGTVRDGLLLRRQGQESFDHFTMGYDENSVINLHVSSIAEDKDGNIWIGGNDGIDIIDPNTGKVIHYQNDPERPGSLVSNTILWILNDSRNNIWVGTQEGLELYDEERKSFRHFSTKDGLPHNTILTILEDDSSNLWFSTPNGISQMVFNQTGPEEGFSFRRFDERDGLQGRVFNENAAIKTSSGDLIFGGPRGFNIVSPGQIDYDVNSPKIFFADFQLFNETIEVGEKINGKVVLEQSVSETDQVTLKHDQNMFSLEFAAITFFQPEKVKYRYKLDGFDQKWHETDYQSRKVTYTNLDPGVYEFIVMASNPEGAWSEEGKRIKISILAPLWKTTEAYIFYVLLILAILYIGRRRMLQRERLKFSMEQERREARQLHELDLMKIRFFTNISHEFRTPLALILAPVEKLLSRTEDAENQKQFQMIHRNARRLLNMVNQLLDFRKLEVDGVNFHPSEGNIIKFMKESVQSFSDLSEKKNIELSFQSDTPELQASFDMDKLEKILFNLLSNAFKFTPEDGKIEVMVKCHQNDSSSEYLKIVEIQVRDTGIGIPRDKQEKVFERFFRNEVPKNMVNQGSGIGLSITREFVKILGGTIALESEPNVGSCFTVSFPVKVVASGASSYLVEENIPVEETGSENVSEHPVQPAGKKPVVLVVEDHEDFRFYIKDNLKDSFTIIEAQNGKEGWQKAIANIPDLILSDLMMPEIDGIDFCKKIKDDSRTSHIPFVLLTAHTAEEQKLRGLNIGANDYITKPFNFEILISRIQNLIKQGQLFQKAYGKKISVQGSEVEIVSQDDKLILNAARIVEEHMEDPEFSVEAFSKELGMSRANLYKKLLSITGQSPAEFIRKIRLQRAAQYLEKGQLSVSEVAYKVGFNNARYFSKYFKQEFDILPSMYADKVQAKK